MIINFQRLILHYQIMMARSEYFPCLTMSLFWCDMFNLTTGLAWLITGAYPHGSLESSAVLQIGGLALSAVSLLALLSFCLGRGASDCWFRVYMFPGRAWQSLN